MAHHHQDIGGKKRILTLFINIIIYIYGKCRKIV